MAQLCSAIEREGLDISLAKTRLHGTDPALVTQAQQALNARGCRVQAVLRREVKDLWVGQAGGRRKLTGLRHSRLKLAFHGARRVASLRFTRRAGHLAAIGVIPRVLYGSAAGVAPRLLQQLRAVCTRAVRSGSVDCCPAATLVMPPCPPGADPAERCRVLQLTS